MKVIPLSAVSIFKAASRSLSVAPSGRATWGLANTRSSGITAKTCQYAIQPGINVNFRHAYPPPIGGNMPISSPSASKQSVSTILPLTKQILTSSWRQRKLRYQRLQLTAVRYGDFYRCSRRHIRPDYGRSVANNFTKIFHKSIFSLTNT